MRTVSLRRRVTWLVLVVLASALLVSGVAVDAVFGAQASRSLTTLLDGRAQLARQLARQGVPPAALVRRVQTQGVQAGLVLANGTAIGEPLVAQDGVRTVETRLTGPGRVDGSHLTLAVDTSLLQHSHRTLRLILLIAGSCVLVLAGLTAGFGTRRALAPLDTMTALARSIAAGGRGGRLRVDRTDTELGRTGAAFDAMLDELEIAEVRRRRFVADAAHELRTPIAGIRAAADVLRSGAGDPDERRRLQDLLVAESIRASELVDDLLESARLDEGAALRDDRVDLDQVVARELNGATAAGIEATFATAPGQARPIVVRGDGPRLAALVRNLVLNAVRALEGVPQPRLDVAADTSMDGATLTVTDNGPGIAPDDRERVFDRLVRLDDDRARPTGGSGLGLAIARATARRHGGDLVCVARTDGRSGACFVLTLPADRISAG